MDKSRAIDRVRKCLALGKSPNEHEAAAALRQAQKLMKVHGITEDEVGLAAYVDSFVDHDDYAWARRKPMVIVCVASLMIKAFGVEAVWERSPEDKHRIRYFGQKQNVMLAVFAHTVVYRASASAWREHLRDKPWVKGVRNARASFIRGWCMRVASKIEDLSPKDEEATNLKRKKDQHYGGELKEAKGGTKTVYTELISDGIAAGDSFSIHKPVNTDKRSIEHTKGDDE